jgi:hypothetical protein
MVHQGIGEAPRQRPRFIFQIDSDSEGAVIRVLDTQQGTVFREVSVQDFLAFAKKNKNVKAFLLGQAT